MALRYNILQSSKAQKPRAIALFVLINTIASIFSRAPFFHPISFGFVAFAFKYRGHDLISRNRLRATFAGTPGTSR